QRRLRGAIELEVGARDRAPGAARIEVRREQGARAGRRRGRGTARALGLGEVRVEERDELVALGGIGAPVERRLPDLELTVGVAQLAVGGLEARRVEHQELVE